MTETTIQQLKQIKNASADDFECRFFVCVLALDAAASTPETDEPGEMARCVKCDDLWPTEDLYKDGLCPNCVICRHYEARQRRIANRKNDND